MDLVSELETIATDEAKKRNLSNSLRNFVANAAKQAAETALQEDKDGVEAMRAAFKAMHIVFQNIDTWRFQAETSARIEGQNRGFWNGNNSKAIYAARRAVDTAIALGRDRDQALKEAAEAAKAVYEQSSAHS